MSFARNTLIVSLYLVQTVTLLGLMGSGLWVTGKVNHAYRAGFAPLLSGGERQRSIPLYGPLERNLARRLTQHGPDFSPRPGALFRDRTGRLMGRDLNQQEFYFEPLASNEIPSDLVLLLTASEDQRFWKHPGVDPVSILRSAWLNLRAGEIVSGASTIAMQLAKQIWLDRRVRGIRDKFVQAGLALRLTTAFCRADLLTWYINIVPLGHNYLGFQAASRGYFGRPLKSLSRRELAALVAIIPAPRYRNPRREPAENRRWRRRVLQKAFGRHQLTAPGLPLPIRPRARLARENPFIRYALGSDPILRSRWTQGAEVPRLSLDSRLNRAVTRLGRDYLRREGRGKNINQIAVLAVKNDTGEILVWTTVNRPGRKVSPSLYSGPLLSRQAGSTLKPFAVALALEGDSESGYDESQDSYFHPGTILADLPPRFQTGPGGATIRNYGHTYFGPVRLRVALANSLNIASVDLVRRVGVSRFLDRLRAGPLGTTLDRGRDFYGAGLVLGNSEVRLLDLVRAYTALARQGSPIRLTARRVSVSRATEDARWFSRRAAWLTTDILRDPVAREPVFGGSDIFDFPFPVALKTGTSEGYRDNWVVGFTPRYTLGVWAGNVDRRPMIRSSGITGAGPVFRDSLFLLMKDQEPDWPGPPPGVKSLRICPDSGMPVGSSCPAKIEEKFIIAPGFARYRQRKCDWHRPALRKGTNQVATTNIHYPVRYRNWAVWSGRVRPEDLVSVEGENPRITSPRPGQIFRLNPDRPRRFQKILFRVSGPPPDGTDWYLNGEKLTTTRNPGYWWSPRAGNFRLSARDGDLEMDQIEFRVMDGSGSVSLPAGQKEIGFLEEAK